MNQDLQKRTKIFHYCTLMMGQRPVPSAEPQRSSAEFFAAPRSRGSRQYRHILRLRGEEAQRTRPAKPLGQPYVIPSPYDKYSLRILNFRKCALKSHLDPLFLSKKKLIINRIQKYKSGAQNAHNYLPFHFKIQIKKKKRTK